MESVTIQLSPDDVARLDELRAERNLTRGQLVSELLDGVKHRPATRRASTERQSPNPWAQAWPS